MKSVEMTLLVRVSVTVVGVAITDTVGPIVRVFEVTVEIVMTLGAVVNVSPVTTVLMTKEVTVKVDSPGKVEVVKKVVTVSRVVESTVLLNVVEVEKLRGTNTVVEKEKEVRAERVCVLLVLTVVRRKEVRMSKLEKMVLVLVKKRVMIVKSVRRLVLVDLAMMVSVSVRKREEVRVLMVLVV